MSIKRKTILQYYYMTILIMYHSPHYMQLIVRWERCTWERSHTHSIQRLISQRRLPPSPQHSHVTILIMYPSPHYVQLTVRLERCTWERSHNHSIQRVLS